MITHSSCHTPSLPAPSYWLWPEWRSVVAVLGISLFAGTVQAGDSHASSTATNGAPTSTNATESAVFAGGCFWCVEKAFDEIDGVKETISGYTGGEVANPSYEQVSRGDTGHTEALKVVYDPTEVSYDALLETFWHNIDPLDAGGQFCDRGSQYRSGIFYANDAQRQAAEASKAVIGERFNQPIATEISPLDVFYPAEAYHQNYHAENPIRYRFYTYGCGRKQRLEELWGEP